MYSFLRAFSFSQRSSDCEFQTQSPLLLWSLEVGEDAHLLIQGGNPALGKSVQEGNAFLLPLGSPPLLLGCPSPSPFLLFLP